MSITARSRARRSRRWFSAPGAAAPRGSGVRADLDGQRHVAGLARRAAPLRHSRPQRRPVSLLPSDVPERIPRSRRPGLAHRLPRRRHQLQHPLRRAHEDRGQHRRRRRSRIFRRAQQRRRQSLPLPVRAHRRRRHRRVHRRGRRAAQRVPPERRLHVERRLLGLARMGESGSRRSAACFRPSASRSSTSL